MFDYLVVGLSQLHAQQQEYPYPAPLQHALNVFAARAGVGLPAHFNHLLRIFRQPIRDWWREEFGALPQEIDDRFPLLQDGDQLHLDEQIEEYLAAAKISASLHLNPHDVLLHQHNKLVANLVEELRALYNEQPKEAQDIYIKLRSFINDNAFTTPMRLARELRLPAYQAKVQALYEPVTAVHDLARRDGCFLNCPNCGVVVMRNHIATSPKHSLCGEQCVGDGEWRRVSDEDNLLVLKRGVLLRTHIPGQPEMRIFRWLKDTVCHEFPELDVTLYPGVDRYDIHLRFGSASQAKVWAVDVKDHRTPAALISHLSDDPRPYGLGDWRWDYAYFVIPDFRVRAYPNFIRELRDVAKLPRLNVNVVREAEFRKKVVAQLMGKAT